MKEEIYRLFQTEEMQKIARLRICGITFPDKHYAINRKQSKYACIEYVESGTGTVELDGERFFPAEGDSYFLHAGHDQHYFSDADTPWKKYFLNLSGPMVDAFIALYGLEGKYHFPGLSLKSELCRIIELAKHKGTDASAEIFLIVHEIFLKMHGHLCPAPRQDAVAAEMRGFLDTRIEETFCMRDLCEHILRSESQAIRIFKKAYGVTPYRYVLDKKIAFAKDLLRNTTLSVSEIAARLHFTDAYYFSNLFKQKTSLSPTAYRNK